MSDATQAGAMATSRPAGPPLRTKVAILAALLAFGGLLAWALVGAGGNLGYRSVAEAKAVLPIGPEIARVRIELQNGTVGIDSGARREVDYAVGVRRAADTQAELEALERIPFLLQPATDPAQPGVLILRGPTLPAQSSALLALQLGIHLPPDLPVEVVVLGNGHITLANRTSATDVSTGRGDLRFEGCAGGVKARTGRGNVITFDHVGDVDMHTMVGDMQALVRQPGRRIRLVTGQGTVQCLVPEAIEFDLDARAEQGKIGNGFGLRAEKVGEFGAALAAKRGGGGTEVLLRTGSGHLSFAPKQFD